MSERVGQVFVPTPGVGPLLVLGEEPYNPSDSRTRVWRSLILERGRTIGIGEGMMSRWEAEGRRIA